MDSIPVFEYDPEKSAANRAKQGIDFEEAQALWLDSRSFEVVAEELPEMRLLRIGKIEEVFWTAVYTWHETRLRLISVRRSRTKERLLYEAQNDQR